MFSKGVDLFACNEMLVEAGKPVWLLGEIEFTFEDFRVLSSLVIAKLTHQFELGLDFLERQAPACLAYYLLGHGIWNYKEGDYWSAIDKETGKKEALWQNKMSDCFFRFLKQGLLDDFRIPGALRNITPILLHGGIPNSCIENFFEKIVDPLFIQKNILDSNYISIELNRIRDQEAKRIVLQNDLQKLIGQNKALTFEIEKVKKISALQLELSKLKAFTKDVKKWRNWFDYTEFRKKQQAELEWIKVELARLNDLEAEYRSVILENKDRDVQQVVEQRSNELLRLLQRGFSEEFNLEWDEQYGESLRDLDLNWLQDRIWFYQFISGFTRKVSGHFEKTSRVNCRIREAHSEEFFSILAKSQECLGEIHQQIMLALGKLPVTTETILNDDGELIGHLEQIQMIFQKYEQNIRQQKELQQDWQLLTSARAKLIYNIWPTQQELRTSRLEILRQIDNLDCQLCNFGAGSLEASISLWQEKMQAPASLEEIKLQFDSEIKTLGFLPPLPNTIEAWSQILKAKQALFADNKEKIIGLKRELQQYDLTFSYADEPVKRFLIYGGQWAEEWLITAVHMYQCRQPKEQARNNFRSLPSRVIRMFEEYLTSLMPEEVLCGGDPFDSLHPANTNTITDKIGQSDQKEAPAGLVERLRAPYLELDAGLGELKLIIPEQVVRILKTDAPVDISLVVQPGEEGNPGDVLPLKGFWVEDELVVIEKNEYLLPVIEERYYVSLMINQVVKRQWFLILHPNIIPLLMFNRQGKLITTVAESTEQIWLVSTEKIQISPNEAVVMAEEMLQSSNFGYLWAVNLTGSTRVEVRGEQGLWIKRLPDGRQTIPFIHGGTVVEGCTIDGQPIYSDLPAIIIPGLVESEKMGWEIGVTNGNSDQVVVMLPLWSEELEITFAKDKISIPLQQERLMGLAPPGRCEILIRTPEGKFHRFLLNYFCGLEVYFDPPVFFPDYPEEQSGCVEIIVFEATRLIVEPPAKIITIQDETYTVEFYPRQEVIKFQLAFNSTADAFTLDLAIPILRWRLRGAGHWDEKWRTDYPELWSGLWSESENLRLQVQHQSITVKYAELCLEGEDQTITVQWWQDSAEFNLLIFADTLRRGAEVYSFELTVFDHRNRVIEKGRVFRVRCLWRVTGFTASVSPDGEETVFSWQDLGQPDNRVIRLWSLAAPWEKPLNKALSAGGSELIIGQAEKIAGPYLVEFTEDDPWRTDETGFPQDTRNNFMVKLKAPAYSLEDFRVDWIDDNKVLIQGAGLYPRAGISVWLLGLVGGVSAAWQVDAETGEQGKFTVAIGSEDYCGAERTGRNLTIRLGAHWVAIFMKTGREWGYQIAGLPDPGPLEFLLTEDNLAIFKTTGNDHWRIKLVFPETVLVPLLLTTEESQKVLKDWQQGETQGETRVAIGRKRKTVKIPRPGQGNCLPVEIDMIKCKSCGEMVPSQEEWDNWHYPRCKSVDLSRKPVKAMIYVLWDSRGWIDDCCRQYPRAGQHPLTLFSSWYMPFPREVDLGDKGFLIKHVPLLWQREMQVARRVRLRNGD